MFRNSIDTMYSLCTMKVLPFHEVCLWKLGLDKIVLCFSTEIDHRIGQDLLMLGHVICSPIVGSSLGLSCTGGHFLMVCVCVGGGGGGIHMYISTHICPCAGACVYVCTQCSYRIARNVRGQKFSRISRMVFQSRKLFFAKFTSTFRYYNYTPSSQILSADAIFRRTRLAHVFGGSLLCLSVCSSFNSIASSLLFSSVLVRFISC